MAVAEEAIPEAEAGLGDTGLPIGTMEDATGGPMLTFEDACAMHGIYPAKAKARLSEEERLAREMERRRQLDSQRRARIFDAKRRAIGLDMETLDAQVKERKAREASEQSTKKAEAQEMLRINNHLKAAENQKIREKRDAEKDAKEFSLANLHFAARREYDLNDPHHKKKEQPARVGDTDPRCGVSSMQKFQGEDLMKDERVRQQRIAQASWVEQQKFEKAVMKLQESQEEAGRAAYLAQLVGQVDARQEDDANYRKAMREEQRNHHLATAAANASAKVSGKANENAINAAELDFHANDPFLQETGEAYLETGRFRRDAYKGSNRAERAEVMAQQREQAVADANKRAQDKAEELAFHRETDMTRKQLVAMEREKQRSRRAMMEQIAQENLAMKEAQAQKKNHLDAVVYTNVPTDDYFAQFGKGCR